MELEREISPQTRLKVAGYQKNFRDLITRDQRDENLNEVYLNQGQGYARGIELSVKHRAGDRLLVGRTTPTPFPSAKTVPVIWSDFTRLISPMLQQ